jgi:hypothetical protein
MMALVLDHAIQQKSVGATNGVHASGFVVHYLMEYNAFGSGQPANVSHILFHLRRYERLAGRLVEAAVHRGLLSVQDLQRIAASRSAALERRRAKREAELMSDRWRPFTPLPAPPDMFMYFHEQVALQSVA